MVDNYGFGAGNQITVGPDGNIWFVEGAISKIGMITPAGVITEYSVPAGQDPHAIVAGPDGNLWFRDRSAAAISRCATDTCTCTRTDFGGAPFNHDPDHKAEDDESRTSDHTDRRGESQRA